MLFSLSSRKFSSLVVLLVLPFLCGHSPSRAEETVSFPKNIIVMIGDGWGYNHVEAARCYQYGETGGPVYLEFDCYGMSTFPAGAPGYDPEKTWSDFDSVHSGCTDSAAAGTALATGF